MCSLRGWQASVPGLARASQGRSRDFLDPNVHFLTIEPYILSKNAILAAEKHLGRVFWGIKSPCGNGDTHSLVLGKYRSRTRCLQGASSVCQPTGQSDDGGHKIVLDTK